MSLAILAFPFRVVFWRVLFPCLLACRLFGQDLYFGVSRTSLLIGLPGFSSHAVSPSNVSACHLATFLKGNIINYLIQVHSENDDSCRSGHSSGRFHCTSPFLLCIYSLLQEKSTQSGNFTLYLSCSKRSCTQSRSGLIRQGLAHGYGDVQEVSSSAPYWCA